MELGAADAVNLDGGGISTMWLAGTGVVNNPSDGSQRVVANHLAIRATGAGPAPNCVAPPAPPVDAAPADAAAVSTGSDAGTDPAVDDMTSPGGCASGRGGGLGSFGAALAALAVLRRRRRSPRRNAVTAAVRSR